MKEGCMPKFFKQKNNASHMPGTHRFTDHIKKKQGSLFLRKIFRKVYPRRYEYRI